MMGSLMRLPLMALIAQKTQISAQNSTMSHMMAQQGLTRHSEVGKDKDQRIADD